MLASLHTSYLPFFFLESVLPAICLCSMGVSGAEMINHLTKTSTNWRVLTSIPRTSGTMNDLILRWGILTSLCSLQLPHTQLD